MSSKQVIEIEDEHGAGLRVEFDGSTILAKVEHPDYGESARAVELSQEDRAKLRDFLTGLTISGRS